MFKTYEIKCECGKEVGFAVQTPDASVVPVLKSTPITDDAGVKCFKDDTAKQGEAKQEIPAIDASPAIGVAMEDSFTCPECKKTFVKVLMYGAKDFGVTRTVQVKSASGKFTVVTEAETVKPKTTQEAVREQEQPRIPLNLEELRRIDKEFFGGESVLHKKPWITITEIYKLAKEPTGTPKPMDFSAALLAMKNGSRVHRKSWNNNRGVFRIGNKLLIAFRSGNIQRFLPSESDILAADWIIVP
jgi:hypothetical protein